MHLERLELLAYRNYTRAELDLGPGVRVFVGPNAQGKTNLLEAVHYLAIGGSHRVSSDAPLVQAGSDAAVIRAVARTSATVRRLAVELELRPGGRNRAQLAGQRQARVADVIGTVRSVLFAPEDLELVRGDPGTRRRFLDDLLGQRRRAYLAAKLEYDRTLRQRNALLKRLRGRSADATLDTWTAQLVTAGATLLAARIAAVHALAGPTAAAYSDLVASSPAREAVGEVGIGYVLSTGRRIPGRPEEGMPAPAALAAELAAGLAAVSEGERERGITLAGPHRDDVELTLNGLPAKGYASHGETWSLALALRLGSRAVLAEVGEEPVVLLDDVFAELDVHRRARLARRCEDFEQVLVTAAVEDDVPLDGPRAVVHAGTVTPRPVREAS